MGSMGGRGRWAPPVKDYFDNLDRSILVGQCLAILLQDIFRDCFGNFWETLGIGNWWSNAANSVAKGYVGRPRKWHVDG